MSISAENVGGKNSDPRKPKKATETHFGKLDKVFRNYLSEKGIPLSTVAEPQGAITTLFADSIHDRLLMVKIIKKGITYSLFEEIQKLSSLTNKEWADILNISIRSLQRYKDKKQLFKPIQSEKILELGEIFILGNEVFGDPGKFKLWLETPNFALGSVIPSSLLADSYGQELLVNELTRINYGIFA
jgi:putative toxin-antitoxin system antitoxin component (TIGR02293 family)